jgi:hypothetical protein
MSFYKYRLYIVIAFISIFTMKMVISVAPVFSTLYKSCFVPDPDQEHGSEGDSTKDQLKFKDYRTADLHYSYVYVPLLQECGIKNCCIDHSKRHVDPYHPSVPTPPPNTAVAL